MYLCCRVDCGGLIGEEKGDKGRKAWVSWASPQPLPVPGLSWFLHSSQSHESRPLVSWVMTLRAWLWMLAKQKVEFRYGGVCSLLIGWDIVWWLDSDCQHSVVWPSVICSQVFVFEQEMRVFCFKGEVSGKPLWNKRSFLLLWTFQSNAAYFKATHTSQSIHTGVFQKTISFFFLKQQSPVV